MLKKTLLGVSAAALMASGAMAGEPLKLTDTQMDQVNGGAFLILGLGLTGGQIAGNFLGTNLSDTSSSAASDQTLINAASGTVTTNIVIGSGAFLGGTITSQGAGQYASGGTLAVSGTLAFP